MIRPALSAELLFQILCVSPHWGCEPSTSSHYKSDAQMNQQYQHIIPDYSQTAVAGFPYQIAQIKISHILQEVDRSHSL